MYHTLKYNLHTESDPHCDWLGHRLSHSTIYGWVWLASYLFRGKTAWQLTLFQTVYEYDVKKITAAPVQAMNIG